MECIPCPRTPLPPRSSTAWPCSGSGQSIGLRQVVVEPFCLQVASSVHHCPPPAHPPPPPYTLHPPSADKGLFTVPRNEAFVHSRDSESGYFFFFSSCGPSPLSMPAPNSNSFSKTEGGKAHNACSTSPACVDGGVPRDRCWLCGTFFFYSHVCMT